MTLTTISNNFALSYCLTLKFIVMKNLNFKISVLFVSFLIIMLISITGCEKNEIIVPPDTYPIDQTDYLADRDDIFSFYNTDPIHYFGHHGIPALCRLSNLNKTIGSNYLNAFDILE